MIGSGFFMFVKFFEIFYEIMDSLCIKEFSKYLRRLCDVNCSKILLHGCIVIPFLIQVISIFTKYDILRGLINTCFLSNIDGKNVKIPLIQNLQLLLQAFLLVTT